MTESQEYDIIFAGGELFGTTLKLRIAYSGSGGTTACVIAGQLTAIDPSLKILLIESGQHTRDVPEHVQPCRYVDHLPPDSTAVSFYAGRPTLHLNGRSPVVSCGRSVGGGSTVNFMLYVRGAASDYNQWGALGNKGWSFGELLPYIKKLESFTPIPNETATHGHSGPIKISACTANLDIGNQFLKVAREYDKSRPQVDDVNDFVTPNAYGPIYRYIHPDTGRRSDAASGYLYPHAENTNLTIMVGKRVKRVVLENGRAVAVEYVTDPRTFPEASREVFTAKARKLIVVSAGALGSPTILERSGIGSPSILEKNHINVLVDLPGVGENYQDHLGTPWAYYGSDETETMDEVWKTPEGLAERLREWKENGKGKVAHNGAEAVLKMRPTEAQLACSGAALQQRWDTFFLQYPDKPMAILAPFSGLPLPIPLPTDRKILSMIYYILYPESIGSVHITSAEDVNSPPDIDTDFLTKPGDVAQLTMLYKMSRELIRRMPCYRGEVTSLHPQFSVGSAAESKEYDVPAPISAPDIVYSDADNEAIVNFNRDNAVATWHALGTCAMKPRSQGGVVDARLNVYGVEGLKVADMSICPTNVGNNTYSTALLVGEKATAIIAEDLGYTNI